MTSKLSLTGIMTDIKTITSKLDVRLEAVVDMNRMQDNKKIEEISIEVQKEKADLEKLRNKRLLKQFEIYKKEANNKKTKKIKEVRVEALRAGFKQCYQDKDFTTIVLIGDKIPNNLLMEDEVLLQFYDIAVGRV
jgi:hypothetical protein